MQDAKSTAHPLESLRGVFGESQEHFARRLNMSVRFIAGIERREYEATPWKLIEALTTHFGLSLDVSKALCDGSISDAELKRVLKKAKGGAA